MTLTRTVSQALLKAQEEVPLNACATSRIATLTNILTAAPYSCQANLATALAAGVGEAVAHIAHLASNYIEHAYAGTTNLSGDEQLQLDLDCDAAVFDACRKATTTTVPTTSSTASTATTTDTTSSSSSSVFAVLATEETPVETVVDNGNNGNGLYSMGCDPLDGSSIMDANFTVGSIFGIWPGRTLIGRTGREQVAAAVALYGPRTVLCIALPARTVTTTATATATDATSNAADNSQTQQQQQHHVLEVTLVHNRSAWELSRDQMHLERTTTTTAPGGSSSKKKKFFAPGNLRATTDHPRYANMVAYWMQERYQLRYTGGMVPDVYHMLAKSSGIFTNVSSRTAQAKLRLLYEVAPMGLIVECAGGAAMCDNQELSVLDVVIDHTDHRMGVCFGSIDEVEKYKEIMFGDGEEEGEK